MTIPTLIAVFIGGGAGASCRYGVGRVVGAYYRGAFPLGTFLINGAGCFALGLVYSLLAARHDTTFPAALIETGFLGGYTTFSSYALETVLLHRGGRPRLAVLNLVGSVALGLLAAAAGAGVTRLA